MKREMFGKVAIRLGYVTKERVKEALLIQRRLREKNKEHKLIGMVMLEQGMLGTTELIEIIRQMQIAEAIEYSIHHK